MTGNDEKLRQGQGLMLGCAFIVRLDEQQITFGPGKLFGVAEGVEHAEQIGLDGARLCVSRLISMTGSMVLRSFSLDWHSAADKERWPRNSWINNCDKILCTSPARILYGSRRPVLIDSPARPDTFCLLHRLG